MSKPHAWVAERLSCLWKIVIERSIWRPTSRAHPTRTSWTPRILEQAWPQHDEIPPIIRMLPSQVFSFVASS